MGLLAPLYALGALAIAGPIIFHLIRRQPQGQMQFSSLMFLQPSPPRLTRRSRIDNWFLLMLRILAIALIAIAFARPYMRQESLLNMQLDGRTIVLLIDTSASMRRTEVWQSTVAEVEKVLDSLAPQDQVALYTIDDTLHPILPLENQLSTEGNSTQQAVRTAIKQVEPSYRKTQLAEGLAAVADLLNSMAISGQVQAGTQSEVVLISDLHEDCGLDQLQGFPWPQNIQLDVRRILPAIPGNARASLMFAEEGNEENASSADEGLRLRVENNPDSKQQSFELSWASGAGRIAEASTRIQVPPGQVRVIPLPVRPTAADRITLYGDAWNEDNDVYAIATRPTVQKVALVTSQREDPADDIGYFVKKAPLDTRLVTRELVPTSMADLSQVLNDPDFKAIILEPLAGIVEQADALRAFATNGGTVVISLSRPGVDVNLQQELLEQTLDLDKVTISEAVTKDFALMSGVDYQHPVFAPFADPRYNDFSKIRFWSHRTIEMPADAKVTVVANFDDESPMLIQKSMESGNVWVVAAGWQPEASGLGLSSKFVPILMGILDPSGVTQKTQYSYEVGQSIIVSELQGISVLDPSGNEADGSTAEVSETQVRIWKPGLYRLQGENAAREVAIQIPASEGHLAPLDVDVFEQYGISLGQVASEQQLRDSARQMQIEELERKQRLWQWLIAAGIVVLALETLIAGWSARTHAKQLASA